MKTLLYIGLFVLVSFAASAQNYQVIVNNSSAVSSITTGDLSKIFLKKSTKWADGSKITPIDLSAKFSIRGDFSKGVHGKSVGAIKSYWQQYVFSGKGTPIVEKKNEAEVLEYVKNNPGSIAYVSSSAAIKGVKVVTIN